MGDVLTINRTPTDFVSKTRHLSVEDRGAYQEILDQIVILGQDAEPPSLPDDDRVVANLLGWSIQKWRKTKARLATGQNAVLIIEGGKISQTRIVEEIEAARVRIAGASKAGIASAAKRAELRKRMSNGRTNVRPTDVPTSVVREGQRRGNADPNAASTSHESRVMKEPTEPKVPPVLKPPDGGDHKARARKPAGSSEAIVETFQLADDHRIWAAQNCPSVPVDAEFEDWRDRLRANGYRTNQGPVRDPAASWRTSMKNAEKWGTYRKSGGGNGNGNGRTRSDRRANSGGGADQAGTDPSQPTAADFGMRTAADVLSERQLQDVQKHRPS